MNYIDQIFKTLDLEPTKNQREIKKAYAKLVKRYHPEEYPEEWKRIHNAYESAMKYAKEGEMPIEIPDLTVKPADKEKIDFNSILSKAQKRKEETYQAGLDEAIARLQALDKNSKDESWEQVLDSTAFRSVLKDTTLLKIWAQLLQKHTITLYIFQKIQGILNSMLYELNEGIEASNLQGEIHRVQQAAIQSYKRYQEKHTSQVMKREGWKVVVIKLAVSIFCVGVIFVFTRAWESFGASGMLIKLDDIFSSNRFGSEKDASSKIAAFLNEKYVTTQYDAAEIRANIYKAYALGASDGYCSVTDEGSVWIVYFDEEVICYDDFQKQEIEQALGQVFMEELGFSDCFFLNLNVRQSSDIITGGNWWGAKAGYIQRFNGELESFFSDEMAAVKAVATDEVRTPPEMVNGGIAVYFPDTKAVTITEQIRNPVFKEIDHYQEVLREAEERYHLRIHSCVMPQDYYTDVKLVSEQSLDSVVHVSESRFHNKLIPFYFTGVTASYAKGEGMTQEIVPLAKGVYVTREDAKLQKPVWKEEVTPVKAKQFIKERQDESFSTFSCSLSRADKERDISLLLDIQELGIEEKELHMLIPNEDGFQIEKLEEAEWYQSGTWRYNLRKLDERYIILNYISDYENVESNIYTLYWKEQEGNIHENNRD